MTTITFCCNGKKCPVVTKTKKSILIGGKEEGFTEWTDEQFKDFLKAAKSGKFDELIK